MAAPYLYRTTSLSVDSVTLTVTHGLSIASASLQALITHRANVLVRQVGLDANTILLRGAADSALIDLAVVQFHSLQGGPV